MTETLSAAELALLYDWTETAITDFNNPRCVALRKALRVIGQQAQRFRNLEQAYSELVTHSAGLETETYLTRKANEDLRSALKEAEDLLEEIEQQGLDRKFE